MRQYKGAYCLSIHCYLQMSSKLSWHVTRHLEEGSFSTAWCKWHVTIHETGKTAKNNMCITYQHIVYHKQSIEYRSRGQVSPKQEIQGQLRHFQNGEQSTNKWAEPPLSALNCTDRTFWITALHEQAASQLPMVCRWGGALRTHPFSCTSHYEVPFCAFYMLSASTLYNLDNRMTDEW